MRLIHGECLEEMTKLPDNSVDMVLTDPPYGTTACKWDSVIPFEPMWEQLKRIAKKNSAIVMTASQPFTSALVMSNTRRFKQAMIWDKRKGTTPLLAKKRPMQSHEDIVVFCYGSLPYNPQMSEGKPYKAPRTGSAHRSRITGNGSRENNAAWYMQKDNESGDRYPLTVLFHSMHCGSKDHPTQKPVALMEYLVKTYTNEGETVLDFTMGSGTTGVACANLGRDFIGIELDAGYFEIARKRIDGALAC
jgi:site-specific DNA-methyltransferase (adenine-specific)